MARHTPRQPLLPALPAVFLLGLLAPFAPAANRQNEILDGLRAEGRYDEAIDYLQRARTNSGTQPAFVQTIDYELAVTCIDAAAGLSEAERDQRLQLAQESLTKFLADQPQHALAAAARAQLGDVLLDRGRLQRILAQQYEGQTRETRMGAARSLLGQADKQWAGIDKAGDEELKQIVFVRGAESKQNLARDQIHRRQVQARLARAWVQYEIGQTSAAGSPERIAALQEAGNLFDAISDQQSQRLADFYARLGRGMCCKDLGESGKAFAIFETLLSVPDEPADFHILRGKAAVQALETALEPDVKKYKQGLDIARRWLGGDHSQTASGAAARAPGDVDLAIRFLGGEAAMAYLKTLPPAAPEQSELRARQIDWARQQFEIVAATAGPYQAKAKVRRLDPALGPPRTSEPGTFADARDHAKAALDRFRAALADQKEAERSGAGNDRDSQGQRQQQIASARTEALKYCQLALDLRTPAIGVEDYDTVRYYLVYLHYASGELDEAAALGETLAQTTGDSPAARQAATIGLAAREALLHRATDAARQTAVDRLQALAERIIQRWGDRPEADDARGIVLDLALDTGQLEKAEQYLQTISAAAPRRGEAELKLGRALWQRARQIWRSSTLEHDHTAEAEKTIARAAGLLGDGIARSRKMLDSGATASLALPPALLALAEIHLRAGLYAEALALLEDPNIARGDSSSLALLACVASGQFDKARVCLQTLQASLPADGEADAARQMLQTCLRINRLLKQHLALFRDRRQDELLQKIVQQFDDFLASLAQGPAASSFFVLAWRAEAYSGLAGGLDAGGPAVLAPETKQYRLAVAALQEIVDRATAKANFSPTADVTVALRIELAHCLRRLSENSLAQSQLLAVLKDHPLMVDAQVEAAYTYQSWGDEKPEYLEMAIQGDKRHQEVWGWGELAKRVQSEARFVDVFHESRYNLALCRLRQAQFATARTQRTRLADAAENDILATQKLSPDMGGAVWYDKYNELLKRIQRLADRPAVGLPAP